VAVHLGEPDIVKILHTGVGASEHHHRLEFFGDDGLRAPFCGPINEPGFRVIAARDDYRLRLTPQCRHS
jgi:hypothetical protein